MIKKLSIAALIAMTAGGMLNATPLTDAIKSVSLNGFLRIRYYYDYINGNNGQSDTDYNRWRTNAKLVFGVPVAENMKIVWRVNAETNDYDGASSNDPLSNTISDNSGLTSREFYVNYQKDKVMVNAGVVPLNMLPYVSSDEYTSAYGPGIVGMYKYNDNVTVAGGWVDHVNNIDHTGLTGDPDEMSNDVYTAGILYNDKNIGKFQVWDYTVTDIVKNAVIVMSDLNTLKDYGIAVHADVAVSKDSDHINNNANYHAFYNIALSGNVNGIDLMGGYAGSNSHEGILVTSIDSALGYIPTELRYNVANMTDTNTWYGKAAFNLNKKADIWGSVAVIDQDKKAGNNDSNEFCVGADYKVNKKLKADIYYAGLNYTHTDDNDQQEVRAEIEYTF